MYQQEKAHSGLSEQGLAKRALEGEREGTGFAQDSNRLKRKAAAALLKGENSKKRGKKNLHIYGGFEEKIKG